MCDIFAPMRPLLLVTYLFPFIFWRWLCAVQLTGIHLFQPKSFSTRHWSTLPSAPNIKKYVFVLFPFSWVRFYMHTTNCTVRHIIFRLFWGITYRFKCSFYLKKKVTHHCRLAVAWCRAQEHTHNPSVSSARCLEAVTTSPLLSVTHTQNIFPTFHKKELNKVSFMTVHLHGKQDSFALRQSLHQVGCNPRDKPVLLVRNASWRK